MCLCCFLQSECPLRTAHPPNGFEWSAAAAYARALLLSHTLPLLSAVVACRLCASWCCVVSGAWAVRCAPTAQRRHRKPTKLAKRRGNGIELAPGGRLVTNRRQRQALLNSPICHVTAPCVALIAVCSPAMAPAACVCQWLQTLDSLDGGLLLVDRSAASGVFAALGTFGNSCEFDNPHRAGELDIRSSSRQPHSRRFETVRQSHSCS